MNKKEKKEKEEEKLHLEDYLKNNNLLYDIITPSQENTPPDFELIKGNKKIYIEHTRLYVANHEIELVEDISINRVMDSCRKAYEQRYGIHISVEFQFEKGFKLPKGSFRKEAKLVDDIVSLIGQNTPKLVNSKWAEKSFPKELLPIQLESLKILIYDGFEESYWRYEKGIRCYGQIRKEEVQPIIKKKNEDLLKKINDKSVYSAYWLLIIVLSKEYSYFYDLQVPDNFMPINCQFDKISLFDLRSRKSFNLLKGKNYNN